MEEKEENVILEETNKKEKKSKNSQSLDLKNAIQEINDDDKVNILRNEKIIVKYIPKENGNITNPKHVLYGGLAEGAKITYTTPRLRNGQFVNILTNEEKDFLENAMGLEYNALSIYNKTNNFWSNVRVVLGKDDTVLDLSDPNQFIAYKILLKLSDQIAPSIQYMQDNPKQTYRFVITSGDEENRVAKDRMSYTMKCYKEYGKIEDDAKTLIVIIETIEGRPVSRNTKLEFLQTKINNLIQADSKLFLKVITDPLLKTKVLIKDAINNGVISNRDGHYYYREDNSPLCEYNQEATLSNAAKYLNNPKHQDILFAIQAKVKE